MPTFNKSRRANDRFAPNANITVTSHLIVRSMGEDILVYDKNVDRVHNLTGPTARVFAACQGEATLSDVASMAGVSSDEADHALSALAESSLVSLPETAAPLQGVSRRRVLAGAAAGAGALAISSVAAPAAAAVVTCPDSDPSLLESFCKVFQDFQAEALTRGDIPAGANTCGAALSFGDLVQCRGFKFFYKETSATIGQNSALGNLKFDYTWCRDAQGVPYMQLKLANGQNFPVGPISTTQPTGCACAGTCLVKIDLPNSSNFIFGYGVPANAVSMAYELCYPVATGTSPTRFSIWRAVIDSTDDLTLISVLPLSSGGSSVDLGPTLQCVTGCANIPALAANEQLVIAFTNIGNNPGDVYINMTPQALPC